MVEAGTGLGADLLTPLEPCCAACNTSDSLALSIHAPGLVSVQNHQGLGRACCGLPSLHFLSRHVSVGTDGDKC